MRLVKLSKEDEELRDEKALLKFFDEELYKKNPPGRFLFGNQIKANALRPGETILFSYNSRLRYVAKAKTGRMDTNEQQTKYRHYFVIEMGSVRKAKADVLLKDLARKLCAEAGLQRSFNGRGWTRIPDSLQAEKIIEDLSFRDSPSPSANDVPDVDDIIATKQKAQKKWMSRKEFIMSKGATCKNWGWSWSFVNESKRVVIFGLWDYHTDGKILSEDWRKSASGWKYRGYSQAREHIRLIEKEGYRLMTFPMQDSDAKRKDESKGLAKIGGFTGELSEKMLTRRGKSWYAVESMPDGFPERRDRLGEYGKAIANHIANRQRIFPDELEPGKTYTAGAKKQVRVNAYERDPRARKACLSHYGYNCAVCGFNFQSRYGEIGKDFVHVHHLKPLALTDEEYELDPVADLRPVCPNCHAMLHRGENVLSIEELKAHLIA